jgi:NAD(P)-dependent dehydrogenase (short-subunit alcohol dehydrogenase family)
LTPKKQAGLPPKGVGKTSVGKALEGRLALVTGAAGILGSRFCRSLLGAGATVIGTDLDVDSIERSVAPETSGFTAIKVDLADEASVMETAARIEKDYGSPRILVNNAASKSSDVRAFFKPFEETSLANWEEVMAVNVSGMMLMCREYGPRMSARGTGGSVINISSIYGVVAPDQRIYEGSHYADLGGAINTPAVYSTSKAAVLGLTRYLATYWAHAGIRVNAISPGGVASGQNDTFKARYSARVPLGRMAEAEELEGALIYLASDASSYVTGQNLIVDGGLSVW